MGPGFGRYQALGNGTVLNAFSVLEITCTKCQYLLFFKITHYQNFS